MTEIKSTITRISQLLLEVQSFVILAVIFYGVVVPIALIRRFLQRRTVVQPSSYFLSRNAVDFSETFDRPF